MTPAAWGWTRDFRRGNEPPSGGWLSYPSREEGTDAAADSDSRHVRSRAASRLLRRVRQRPRVCRAARLAAGRLVGRFGGEPVEGTRTYGLDNHAPHPGSTAKQGRRSGTESREARPPYRQIRCRNGVECSSCNVPGLRSYRRCGYERSALYLRIGSQSWM